MQIKSSILATYRQLSSSPLKSLDQQISRIDLNVDLESLHRISERVDATLRLLEEPLRIVIMGEVKAGKSTLINCLAGTAISPTDVLEATAVISELSFGPGNAKIIYRNGSVENIAIGNNYYKLIESRQKDTKIVDSIDIVRIELPVENLRDYTLCDTPGLLTVTERNAVLALDFVKQCDVVIWVFNAPAVGQCDVAIVLEEVAMMGKPVLGVVNRIDEVDGDHERLIQYMNYQIGHYLHWPLLPLSALNAWQSLVKGNDATLSQSGFTDLIQVLETGVRARRDALKMESALSTAVAALQLDARLHESVAERLEELIKLDDDNKRRVGREHDAIVEDLEERLTNSLDRMLADEESQLVDAIDKALFFKLESASREAVSGFQNELERNIKRYWEVELRSLGEVQNSLWSDAVDRLGSHIRSQIKELDESVQLQGAQIDLGYITTGTDGLDEIVGTATLASLGGAGVAFYMALLGPAAEIVTLLAALGTVVPPVALVGGVIGSVIAWRKADDRKRDIGKEFHERLDEMRHTYRIEFCDAQIAPRLRAANAEIAKQLSEGFTHALFGGIGIGEVRELVLEIRHYCKSSNYLVDQLTGEASLIEKSEAVFSYA